MDLAALQELIQKQEMPLGPERGWAEKLPVFCRGEVLLDQPLKRYTSIQIGGPADAIIFPADLKDFSNLLHFAHENRVPWIVLGNGSNVLIRDGGIRGMVIRVGKMLSQWRVLEESEEHVVIEADAGVSLAKIVEQGRQGGWEKIAPLYGIPASIGGAIWMNAGTRQGEIKDCVRSIKVLWADGVQETLPREKLAFEYRRLHLPHRGIILSGTFSFKKGDKLEIQKTMAEYQEKRRNTQPLDQPSLGSVFKNPDKGFAAQMIEEQGLKGVRVGGARISEKHANFIVNEGGATAKDVLALIGLIKDKIRDELDVKLELEAKVLGEDELIQG
jgi:UDP-N-acetylmuramate dehydrogenase